MKKLLMIILSGFLAFSCIGCTQVEIETSDETDDETEPEEVTEEEESSDQKFDNLKNTNEKINVSDLIGEYEMVVYTMSGYSYVKGTDDWIIDTDEAEDTIIINIIDKKNMTFSNYGDVTKATYTMNGNVISFDGENSGEYAGNNSDEEEVSLVTEGIFVDGILVIDLDGSKMYFGKRGVQSDIEKAEKVCEEIEDESDDSDELEDTDDDSDSTDDDSDDDSDDDWDDLDDMDEDLDTTEDKDEESE